jgi:hypothetical protein
MVNMIKCPNCSKQIPSYWKRHDECSWKKENCIESEMIGKSKIEVFTSPTCPFCPSALKLALEIEKERSDVKVLESSTGTNQGQRRA